LLIIVDDAKPLLDRRFHLALHSTPNGHSAGDWIHRRSPRPSRKVNLCRLAVESRSSHPISVCCQGEFWQAVPEPQPLPRADHSRSEIAQATRALCVAGR
jgi:hypothetical protein